MLVGEGAGHRGQSPSSGEIEPLLPNLSQGTDPPIPANGGSTPSRGLPRPGHEAGTPRTRRRVKAPTDVEKPVDRSDRAFWTATANSSGRVPISSPPPQPLDMECCSKNSPQARSGPDAVRLAHEQGVARGSRVATRSEFVISPARRSAWVERASGPRTPSESGLKANRRWNPWRHPSSRSRMRSIRRRITLGHSVIRVNTRR